MRRGLAQTPVLWGLRVPEGILCWRSFGARILSSNMPLHKRYYSPGQLQFITASTYQRAPLFLSERFRGGFVETLAQARQEMKFLLIGWVFMPNHFHLLLKPERVCVITAFRGL